jgi:hypothetical protein
MYVCRTLWFAYYLYACNWNSFFGKLACHCFSQQSNTTDLLENGHIAVYTIQIRISCLLVWGLTYHTIIYKIFQIYYYYHYTSCDLFVLSLFYVFHFCCLYWI